MKFSVTFTSTVTVDAKDPDVAAEIVNDQMFDVGEMSMPTVTNVEAVDIGNDGNVVEEEPCDCPDCLDNAKRRAGLMTKREYNVRRMARTRG